MVKPGQVRRVVFAIPVLLAAPLLAQRYQEHDHTVFHRSAPPAKHQSATAGTTIAKPTPAAASSTPTRTADANRHHDVTFNPSPSSTEGPNPQSQQAPK
jgi:hypothetical protein